MKQIVGVVLTISVSWLILSCKSDTVGPQAKHITGTVIDTTGNPVANAYLNFFYLTALRPLNHSPLSMPITTFGFDTPRRGVLRVSIENYAHTLVRTFPPDTVDPGVNEIDWDFTDELGRSLYSDVYFVTGILDSAFLKQYRILSVVEQYRDINPAPFATTDHKGRFSIPLSRLPLNEAFVRYNPATGDSIGLYKIGPKDLLYAFTQTSYGVDTVEYSNLRDLTITLSHSK